MAGQQRNIVLDVGARYIRGGFAGEYSPRFIFEHHIFRRDDAGMQLRFYLMEIFNKIFSMHCLVKAKHCNVLIIEKILIQKKFRDYLLSVLLKDFQVHSVSFQPDLYMSILSTGYTTGVIVNIGCRECQAICVVDGRPLIHTLFTAAVGVNHSVESLQIVMEERMRRTVPIESVELLFERVACHCFERDTEMIECEDVEVAPAHGLAVEAFTLSEEERQECLYGLISGECPIQGCMDENGGAAGILMRSLRACEPDTRFHCAQNIILCGGGSMIPGIKEAICAEATDMAHSEPHFQPQLEHMVYKLHTQHLTPLAFPFPPSSLAWVGGSVFASIPENRSKYITLQDIRKRTEKIKEMQKKYESIDSMMLQSEQEAELEAAVDANVVASAEANNSESEQPAVITDEHIVQLLGREEIDDPDYLLDAPDWLSLNSCDWHFCRGGLALHT